MDLTILSRSPGIYSTRRLCEAGSARGHNVRVLDPLNCEILVDAARATLFYLRQPVPPSTVVIPRIARSVSAYGLAVLHQYELAGTPVVNSATAIAQSRNTMGCLQLLSAGGIAIPATVAASKASDLKAMVDLVGGVPVLVKVLQAGMNTQVMVCQSLQSMEAAMDAILGLGHHVVIQQYAADRKDRDIRALVVGGEVVAAIRKRPQSGRLSRSLLRGATLEKVKLPGAYRELAVEATRLVGLEVAAVDMLDLAEGPRVFEVNSSPSLKELEEATRKDLAGAIVQHAEQLAERASAPTAAGSGRGKRSKAAQRRPRRGQARM
jgi:ribosomal protein S6--L-glutamate ligase